MFSFNKDRWCCCFLQHLVYITSVSVLPPPWLQWRDWQVWPGLSCSYFLLQMCSHSLWEVTQVRRRWRVCFRNKKANLCLVLHLTLRGMTNVETWLQVLQIIMVLLHSVTSDVMGVFTWVTSGQSEIICKMCNKQSCAKEFKKWSHLGFLWVLRFFKLTRKLRAGKRQKTTVQHKLYSLPWFWNHWFIGGGSSPHVLKSDLPKCFA